MTINIRTKHGRRVGHKYNAIADGINISADCFYADGRRRVARVFTRDSSGHHEIVFRGGGWILNWKEIRPRRLKIVRVA